MSEPEPIPYHRLFGLILMDFFRESLYELDVEEDLSVQQQLLDVAIVRKGEGTLSVPLPDGLEPLAKYNLLSFRSFHDALDADTMDELLGHYVDYRKLVSPSPRKEDLLPAEDFRLIAVSARYPAGLARQAAFTKVQDGVYDCPWGSRLVRIIVMNQLPELPHNALMHLFTAQEELVKYGQRNFKPRSRYNQYVGVALVEALPGGRCDARHSGRD